MRMHAWQETRKSVTSRMLEIGNDFATAPLKTSLSVKEADADAEAKPGQGESSRVKLRPHEFDN